MSEPMAAVNDESFFGLLRHALQIAKQHWMVLLVFVAISLLVTLGAAMVTGGGLVFAIFSFMTGPSVLGVAMVILLILAAVLVGGLLSLSTLKVVHLALSQQPVTVGEVFSYGIKNVLNFLWTSIVGVIYALRWALLIIVGVPVLWVGTSALRQAKLSEVAQMGATGDQALEVVTENALGMLAGLGFALAILGIIGIAFMIYAVIRIIFLGYAFVADEKRGVEAAKASMELVEGRWWRTFGYIAGITLLFGIGSSLVGNIIEPLAGMNASAGVESAIGQFTAVIIVIFSALLYGVYKKSKQVVAVPETHL